LLVDSLNPNPMYSVSEKENSVGTIEHILKSVYPSIVPLSRL
jgi:hypothetical protein